MRNNTWKVLRYALAAMAIVAGGYLLSVDANASELEKQQDQMFENTVQIGNYCSGAIIKSERDEKSGDVSTYVLTAKHCTKNTGEAVDIRTFVYNDTNRLVETKAYRSEVEKVSFKSDLALIKLRDTDTFFGSQVAKLAPKDVKLTFGEEVFTVGHPGGRSMTFTKGHLGFVEDDLFKEVSTSGQFYRATPDTVGGSSGSSMYHLNEKGDYEVIGVLTGGYRWGSYMNLYTPIEEIHEFLDWAMKVRKVKEIVAE